MDTLFIYLLVAWAVAIQIFPSNGDEISPGLAVRQGEPLRVVTQKNEALVLNCSVEYDASLGSVKFTWSKDGGPLEAGSRVQVLTNGSLVIRRVIHRPRRGRSDEGQYTCRATLGDVGTVIAREVKVLVAGIERKFDQEPQAQDVPVGGVARFQCQIKATPPAFYIWEKDQVKLPQNDDRYLFLSSGILQITGVRISDVGQYRCYATQGSLNELSGAVSDIEGRYSSEAPLTLTAGPVEHQIVASSVNVTVDVGSPAILECLIQGPQTVDWTKEVGAILEPVQLVPGGRVSLLGTNLQIHETELGDGAKYMCKAGNHMKTIVLNVIKAPVLTKVPSSSRHLAGKWVYSQCLAEGSPSPDITYLFNGEPIQFGNEYKLTKVNELFVGEGFVIVLSDQNHSGFYQCRAANSAGNAYGFFRVEFFFQKNAPDIPANLRATNVTSSSVRVVWDPPKPSADPRFQILAYTVKYRQIDESTITDLVAHNQQVELVNLRPFTQYTLYVQAFSSVGPGPQSAELLFRTKESVPREPIDVTLEPRGHSVLVKWSPLRVEDRQGIITNYKIYYRQQQMGSTLIVIPDIPGNATSFIIRGLQPQTSYEVRMLAATSVGTAIFTDQEWPWVPVRTRVKDYVSKPVVTLIPVNQTTLNVSWSYYGDVEVDHFKLELLPLTAMLGNKSQIWNLMSDKRHHIITGLDESTIYEVAFTAVLTDSTEAEVVEEFRASNAPQTPTPRNLHVTLRTANSLSVSWFQPEPSLSQIVRYTVRFSELTAQHTPLGYRVLVSDTTSALIQNLKPGTLYEVAVQSHTEKVHSRFSPKIVESTSQGAVSAPLELKGATTTAGVVRLDWLPPAGTDGNVKSYMILYTDQPDDADDKWRMVTKNGSELSATLQIDDTSGQHYYFKVLAVTGAGTGQATNPVELNPSISTSTDPSESHGLSGEQELGIIIGVSICAAFIIICVIIFLLRSRLFSSAYQQQQGTTPQPPHFHGNGHIPGNGNGHALMSTENSQPVTSAYEMTPMLNQLQENEDSDSKGGGTGNLILTPNGAKLNGFVPLKKNGYKNGQVQNGHIKYLPQNYLRPLDAEQARGLIDAMMSGGNETAFISVSVKGGDSNGPGQYPDTVASLEGIDHLPGDEHISKAGERSSGDLDDNISEVVTRTSGDDSGAGSLTDSCGGGGHSRQTSPNSSRTRQRGYPLDDGIHDYSPPSDLDTGSAESCHLSDVAGPVSAFIEYRDVGALNGDVLAVEPDVCQCDTLCVDDGVVNTGVQPQTSESSDCLQIPRKQPSTSEFSQANDGVTVVTPSSNINCSDNRVTDIDAGGISVGVIPVEVVHRNGTVPCMQNGDIASVPPFAGSVTSLTDQCNSHFSRQPHVYCNGGVNHHPQGAWTLDAAAVFNNPTIPQNPMPVGGDRAPRSGHGGGDSISSHLDSPLAQLPQDAVQPAMVKSSSPRQPHYNV